MRNQMPTYLIERLGVDGEITLVEIQGLMSVNLWILKHCTKADKFAVSVRVGYGLAVLRTFN